MRELQVVFHNDSGRRAEGGLQGGAILPMSRHFKSHFFWGGGM